MRFICCLALAIHFPGLLSAQLDRGDFPIVPDDMEVALFARDPLVRNPCAIAFDAKGRSCVGMGPQYRNPTRETQSDSVWILVDADRDGEAESRKEFGNEAVCVEDTRYVFSRVPEGILLDVDATFFNDERDFVFGDQEESGLAVRMAKNLSVQFGQGGILNDQGERNGSGTWGKAFDWIDYSGVIGNKKVGVMLLPHPGNSRRSWSHSRDYGIVVANPFPKQPEERREPFVKTEVKKGERFRLRYAVLIHETAEDKFDAAEAAAWMLERLE